MHRWKSSGRLCFGADEALSKADGAETFSTCKVSRRRDTASWWKRGRGWRLCTGRETWNVSEMHTEIIPNHQIIESLCAKKNEEEESKAKQHLESICVKKGGGRRDGRGWGGIRAETQDEEECGE